MRLKPAAALAAAVLALCAAAPASAITYTYSAVMNQANEPSFTVAAPNASGIAVVVFDTVALSVAVNEVWFSLTGPITANHIHAPTATAGTGTAGVFLGFALPAVNGASGSTAQSFSYTSTPASFGNLLQAASDGKAYVNVHTAANGGGEIRGFLVGPVVPVPEPASAALMLLGVAAVGGIALRRRA